MTVAPEFHRPVHADTIGVSAQLVAIEAEPSECAALAMRFGLLKVERLEARFQVARDATGIIAKGKVTAAVVQACVATDAALPATIGEDVALRFMPVGDGAAADEVELSADALDIVEFADGMIDLGEAAAETMMLALDPFPRAPGADETLRAAGVLSEGEAGPFAALAALKERLGSSR